MNPESITSVAALVTAIISVLGLIYLAGVKVSKLEVQVETMWTYLMRGALGESLKKGLTRMESPLVVKSEIKKLFEPITNELQLFYKAVDGKLTEIAFGLEIERVFGERILKDISIPHHLDYGACILIAIHLAKNDLEEENVK